MPIWWTLVDNGGRPLLSAFFNCKSSKYVLSLHPQSRKRWLLWQGVARLQSLRAMEKVFGMVLLLAQVVGHLAVVGGGSEW